MVVQDQLAIVTGASSGMGRETAKMLADRGWHVLAGVRKPADGDNLARDNIEPMVLDITHEEHIAAIARRVETDPPRRPLSVLVNNAGISLNAPIETLPLDNWRQHFDVNFFGHVAMTTVLLPALLAANGRVVNISSIGGRVALPTYGPYAASKFALEAFSDVLRRELSRFGLTVIVVEPGTVATNVWNKQSSAIRDLSASWTMEQHERYDSLMATMLKQAEDAEKHGLTASDAAQVIVDAITADTPQTRYLVGDAGAMVETFGGHSDIEIDQMISAMIG